MTAKISRGLVSRIYSHAFEQGWLEPGAIVLDPFGGICGTGLDALWHGLNYVAVELEPKFVALGEANLALWHRKYGSKKGWGTARIVQGDSRRLAEIVGGADLICGSPPYSESITGGGDGIDWKKIKVGGSKRTIGRASIAFGYGTTPGQLGAMPEGKFDAIVKINLDTAGHRDRMPLCKPVKTAEPPLADEVNDAVNAPTSMSAKFSVGVLNPSDMVHESQRQNEESRCENIGDHSMSDGTEGPIIGEVSHGERSEKKPSNEMDINVSNVGQLNISKSITKKTSTKRAKYGTTHSTISKRSAENVTSPIIDRSSMTPSVQSVQNSMSPEQQTLVARSSAGVKWQSVPGQNSIESVPERISALNANDSSVLRVDDGSIAPGNVCAEREQKNKLSGKDDFDQKTFWAAAKIIVAQCHQVLKPNGMAIWVVKDFVRKGKRVPFSDQWLALCEQVGFSLVCCHKAMLVKSHGAQHRLDGEVDELETRRISFFRRLAEKKGSPKIEWETVLCVRKG